jgi:hypothetical protein
MMASTAPYRLQILLDRELRKVLRDIAHQQDTSLQKLVTAWLIEKAKEYPVGQHLELPDKP